MADEVEADRVAEPKKMNRAERRALFFHEKHSKVKPVEMSWNGINFEWRAPTILETQRVKSEEGQHFMVRMLIDNSYLEGTDEKLFEDDDYDKLVNMPLSGEFSKIVGKISEVLDLKVEAKAKN